MSPRISERAFEETIECALLVAGPDACAGFVPAFAIADLSAEVDLFVDRVLLLRLLQLDHDLLLVLIDVVIVAEGLERSRWVVRALRPDEGAALRVPRDHRIAGAGRASL